MLRITSIISLVFLLTAPAEARHRQAPVTGCTETGTPMSPACMGQSNNPFSGARGMRVTMKRERPARRPPVIRALHEAAIVAHPAGCPARQFCGCGAAVRVFGRPVRDLWLAANWYRFPRAAPAPGMAAVRPHHVFVLEADLGGGVWQVFDANSGHHATRIHARAIAGYTIVNPRAEPSIRASAPERRQGRRIARASLQRFASQGGNRAAGP